MSGLETLVVVVGAAWLCVLSGVLIVAIQQLTIVTKRLDLIAGPTPTTQSGPPVGMALPEDAQALLAESDQTGVVLVMSATCGPCRTVADELAGAVFAEPVLVLLTGRDEAADEINSILPVGLEVIRDPSASAYATALGIVHSPFALAVKAGRVVGKSPVNRLDDLLRLVDAYRDVDSEELERV